MGGVNPQARSRRNDWTGTGYRPAIHDRKSDPVRGLKGYNEIGANIMFDGQQEADVRKTVRVYDLRPPLCGQSRWDRAERAMAASCSYGSRDDRSGKAREALVVD